MTARKPIPFSVKYIVAPMVGQSDLSFRLLCRRHGASVAYTEMLYRLSCSRAVRILLDRSEADPPETQDVPSDLFASDPLYRVQAFQSCEADRPLVVQFAANTASALCKAGLAVQDGVDAIDINLGCPQQRAIDGHFGAYLLDEAEWPTVFHMVASLSSTVRVPVFCKIRLLSSLRKTVEFCRGLEAAGCALVAVHGRKRGSPQARRSGAADLQAIKAVKGSLRIPVVSNGNVISAGDVAANLEITGADGIMSAEAVLADPLLFQGGARSREELCEVALEYLELCVHHNTPAPVACQHLHYMLGRRGRGHSISFRHYGGYTCGMDLKRALDNAESIADLVPVVRQSLGVPNSSDRSPLRSPFWTEI